MQKIFFVFLFCIANYATVLFHFIMLNPFFLDSFFLFLSGCCCCFPGIVRFGWLNNLWWYCIITCTHSIMTRIFSFGHYIFHFTWKKILAFWHSLFQFSQFCFVFPSIRKDWNLLLDDVTHTQSITIVICFVSYCHYHQQKTNINAINHHIWFLIEKKYHCHL